MRAYTVATVAVALRVEPKWLDNLLTHHTVPGVSRKRQGLPRRLTPEAVTVLEIVLRLTRSLGLPVARALMFARDHAGSAYREEGIALTVDADAVRADVEARLAEAVELTPTPTRGRPRRRRVGADDG
jgi:hypothetical protein